MRTIGVVVATYNRPDALALVLKGLALQTEPFELVIADDGSGETTDELVRNAKTWFPFPITHVWHPDTGFRLAAIRNKGIMECAADYLIFLDGDCVPQRDFVARHRQLAQPGRMVTGSRILLGQRLTEELLLTGVNPWALAPSRLLKHRIKGDLNKILPIWLKFPAGKPRYIDEFLWRRIKGCNLAAWRHDVLRINGFDESFTGWGHEDADFVLRLFNNGILRTDGAYATEVAHLWHKESSKDQALSNFALVRERVTSRRVTAESGIRQHGPI